jgi:16S rRNA U516 pseudouridylate synthase RsuA-like enzyme
MLERVGHPVIRLIRIAIDGVKLEELKPGQYRSLTKEEIESLHKKVKNIKKSK